MPSLLKRLLKRPTHDHDRLDDIKKYTDRSSSQSTKQFTAMRSTRLDRLDKFRSRLRYRLDKLDWRMQFIDTRLEEFNENLVKINKELDEINRQLDKSKQDGWGQFERL